MKWADIVVVKLSFGVICTVLVREYPLPQFTSARTFDGILHPVSFTQIPICYGRGLDSQLCF